MSKAVFKIFHTVTDWALQHAIFRCLSSYSSVIITAGWLIKDGAKQNSTRLQVDDLNPSLSQLALSAVILYSINALWGLCVNLIWIKPLVPPCRSYWYWECIVFLSHSAGWCRLAVSLLKGGLTWSQLSVQSSNICFLQSVLKPT